MALSTRDATVADIDAIADLGHGDHAFQVSERIRFYERAELEEWIRSPKDNILVVAERGGTVVGFFFCKVMSWHWAMLDNFYLAPDARNGNVAPQLYQALISRLNERRIQYLTTLVEASRAPLMRYLQRSGFRATKTYQWYEVFLDGVDTPSANR